MKATNPTKTPDGGSDQRLVGHFSCVEHDALWTALHCCAARDGAAEAGGVYEWLQKTSRTGVVCGLIEQLHTLGFCIMHNDELRDRSGSGQPDTEKGN